MTRPLAGPQTLLRTINARAILEVLAARGPLTRNELMHDTGLSRTAVTQVLRMLEASGTVGPAGIDRETRGPAATRVALAENLGVALAVHVGHRSVHIALVDATGSVRARAEAPCRSPEERHGVLTTLVSACTAQADAVLTVAVIAVPGIVTATGAIRDERGGDDGEFRRQLEAAWGCEVRIENDGNLAALAELTATPAHAFSSFALLLLDNGIGAGLVINGQLHRGASGVAGEATFLPQSDVPVGAPVLRDSVIAELARARGLNPDATLLTHLDAAATGDPSALSLVDEVARRLTLVAASIALILDPEAFVLGGVASHPAMVAAVERAAYPYAERLPLRFHASSLGGEAPLTGAIDHAVAALRETLFTRTLTDRSQR